MDLPLFASDILCRFAINIIACLLIVYLVYYRKYAKKKFTFAYIILSTTIFFLCYFLATVEFQLGLALGLFAIFGIIRYRTDSVPIKEMSYLFLVIALSIINALVSIENRLFEIGLANMVLVALPFIIEQYGGGKYETMSVTYDNMELLAPSLRDKLIEDLNVRLGVKVKDVVIEKVDFTSNKARLELHIFK